MAFNINGVDLKKFNINIGDTTHAVKRFDVVKDGITTTVWRDILDIYQNSDITWTVELTPADEHSSIDNNDPLGTFSVGRGGGDGKSRTGSCCSSAIDVSDYKTLIWKGECSGNSDGTAVFGHVWAYLYGGTSEGADDVFRITLADKSLGGANKTFDESIDITDVDTLYLTVEIKFESTNDQGGWQNVFTESIIAKNE